MPSLLNYILMFFEEAMAISFQSAHSDCCRKSRTPPFPQTTGPDQVLTNEATTKNPFRGCPIVKSMASLTFHKTSSTAAFEKRPPCPARRMFGGPFIKPTLARRQCGGARGSSKRRIFRIKTTPHSTAARVAVCIAPAQWNPLVSSPAHRSEGRLQRRSRCGLERNAMPSLLNCILIYGGRAIAISFQMAHSDCCRKSRTPPFPQTTGLV